MNIKFNDTALQWVAIEKECLPKLTELLRSGSYIGHPIIEEFENNFAKYCGTKYAVGVSNGTDALKLILQSLNLNQKTAVIIPNNTFIANLFAIDYFSSLTSVIIDCDDDYNISINELENWLRNFRTDFDKVVVCAVHLFGKLAKVGELNILKNKYDFILIEDSSQAQGASYLNIKAGAFGEASAFSLYPGKNLGACGEAGIVTTNNSEIYKNLKNLRNLGSNVKYKHNNLGWNNRIDAVQALILKEKLKYLDTWNKSRIKIAKLYNKLLNDLNKEKLILPQIENNVFHIYPIRIQHSRDLFIKYLQSNNIPTVIHYPYTISESEYYQNTRNVVNTYVVSNSYSKELLSLPMHPFLTDDEVTYICNIIKGFFK